MLDWLSDKELDATQQRQALVTLDLLRRVVHSDNTIAYYEEKSQDLERVLNIFIRCNHGGTSLPYSNILLSMAVFRWKTLDARRSVHGLVDDMNRVRPGLEFDADFVLKAGLFLTDLPNVGFRLGNFTNENMAKLENAWLGIGQALVKTAELVASFGFDSRTIQANNSLLPIAYYLYKIDAPPNFETVDQHRKEREAIRGWLTRSVLKKSGTWSGGAVDTVLIALRQVIGNVPGNGFPVEKMLQVMSGQGRSLAFEEGEIEELAEMRYTDRRIFPLLTIMFPTLGSRDGSDIDHVFPKSRITRRYLRAAKVDEDQIGDFLDKRERLANLQLLDRAVNNEKRATLPAVWLDIHRPDDQLRQAYCERHLLGDVPREITGFLEFYEARRERLEQKIAELINTV